VRLLAREFRIPIMPMGSTTWSREDVDRGLEADESFFLRDLDRVRDPDHAALGTNPPPDLAIEIEMTRSVLNRLGIYGALGVPEVWRFNGLTLLVLLRQEDGSYQESLTSGIFPEVTMAEIARFAIKEGIKDENAYLDEFTNWVRAEVLPRLERRGGS
jgi:Uma2 family endonuclease